MSLLLDALKKAELAKRAIGPDRTQNGPAEIAMEPSTWHGMLHMLTCTQGESESPAHNDKPIFALLER